jgi:triosephosphate isomerase
MRALLAGNWKMNGLKASLGEIGRLIEELARRPATGDVLVCPPATLIAEAAQLAAGTPVAIGGQDCQAQPAGAFTGDISAEMLKDAGASAVILGHSERRQYHGESDAAVAAKVLAARRAGLSAIICIGESEAERDAGRAADVVTTQLRGSVPDAVAARDIVIAYEPVWAIGTGRTPTPAQIAEIHDLIREGLVRRFAGEGRAVRILYGGSVKPSNAAEILKIMNVNGALVGGASLKAAEFLDIVRAAPARADG